MITNMRVDISTIYPDKTLVPGDPLDAIERARHLTLKTPKREPFSIRTRRLATNVTSSDLSFAKRLILLRNVQKMASNLVGKPLDKSTVEGLKTLVFAAEDLRQHALRGMDDLWPGVMRILSIERLFYRCVVVWGTAFLLNVGNTPNGTVQDCVHLLAWIARGEEEGATLESLKRTIDGCMRASMVTTLYFDANYEDEATDRSALCKCLAIAKAGSGYSDGPMYSACVDRLERTREYMYPGIVAAGDVPEPPPPDDTARLPNYIFKKLDEKRSSI